jgi:Rieske Fe-S protein
MRTLAVGAVVGVTGPIVASRAPRSERTTRGSFPAAAPHSATVDVSSLTTEGQWLVAPWPGPDGAPVLIVRDPGHHYMALSMQCTHEGCPVNPPVQKVLTCPCHGSQFDLAGRVRHGPAQYPLGHYDVAYHARTKTLTVVFG